MKANLEKTTLLVISDAVSYTPLAYIETQSPGRLESSSESIRILGFTFGSKPSVGPHIDAMVVKARRRLWVLRHLRHFGMEENKLVEVYKMNIRSIIEYCSVVYHSLLTKEQAMKVERLQYRALKCIYGMDNSYRALLEKTGIEKLEDRREAACIKFAEKARAGKFEHWFPKRNVSRTLRGGRVYLEENARCDRLKNSPLFYMRRRLNVRQCQ